MLDSETKRRIDTARDILVGKVPDPKSQVEQITIALIYKFMDDMDAFEYLLSVLGSQGDAGQFRTPRHIIDFMVEVFRPQKGEVILDPACGTAGFLISAYKHILRNNLDAHQENSTLTPDEKGRMATNFIGIDHGDRR